MCFIEDDHLPPKRPSKPGPTKRYLAITEETVTITTDLRLTVSTTTIGRVSRVHKERGKVRVYVGAKNFLLDIGEEAIDELINELNKRGSYS